MRRLSITLVPLVLILAIGPAAAGGGGSSFELDDPYLVVGDTIKSEATFQAELEGRTGRIAEGPWYAHLLPSRRYIEPPNIPPVARALGPISFERSGRTATARLSFTVPAVQAGEYQIGLCNDPCRKTMVGDLWGTWIMIAESETEAAMMRLGDRIEREVDQARSSIPRRISRQLTRRMDPLNDSIVRVERLVRERLGALEGRLTTLASPRPEGLPSWAGAGWVLAGILALATLVRRRRVPAVPPSEPRWGDVEWVLPEREEVSSRT